MLACKMGLKSVSVRLCVRPHFQNVNISEVSAVGRFGHE